MVGVTTSSRNQAESLLGAFARIYRRDTAEDLAEAFVTDQLVQVQLNLSSLGYPTIPDAEQLTTIDTGAIRAAFDLRGRVIWGVSATYNTAHPDPAVRAADTAKAAEFIVGLRALEPVAATLCTGTRDPNNMWRAHPDNNSSAAWADLRQSLDVLLPAAAEAGILLGIEPEPGNVIAGTAQAQRLLDELGHDAVHVGIILDPANLVGASPLDQYEHILTEAFTRLGDKAICVHAKDTQAWAETLQGGPGVDYRLVYRLYEALPARVPVIIQDATEEELPKVRDWLLAQRAIAQ